MFTKKGQLGINVAIGITAAVLVVINLLPVINNAISNYTGTGSTLLANIPTFLALGLLILAIGAIGVGGRR